MARLELPGLFDFFVGGSLSVHSARISADVVAAVLVLSDELVAVAVPEQEQFFVIGLIL